MAVTAAVAGVVVALAGTGVAVHNTQQAERLQNDAGRDQENAQLQEKASADQANAQKSAEEESVMARARQKALAGFSGGSNYGGTLKTSPLGVPSTPQTSNKMSLGV